MELDPQPPSALPHGVERRPIKVQVTAMREITIHIQPDASVNDIERLVLNEVVQQGLQITAIEVAEVGTEEGPVSAGDRLLSSTINGK